MVERPCTSCAGSRVSPSATNSARISPWRQLVARLDRRLARDGRRESLVPRVRRRLAIARRAPPASRAGTARRRSAGAASARCARAACARRTPPPRSRASRAASRLRLERVALRGREVQRERKEQPLRRRLAALEHAHELLVQHALVRRVLVDEHDAVVVLEQHVGAPQLQQRRHRDRRRLRVRGTAEARLGRASLRATGASARSGVDPARTVPSVRGAGGRSSSTSAAAGAALQPPFRRASSVARRARRSRRRCRGRGARRPPRRAPRSSGRGSAPPPSRDGR